MNKISGCDCCMLARDLIVSASDFDLKEAYIEDRNEHLKQQQQERDAYYERRSEAVIRKNEICSMICDGMDQSKTDLPHYKGWKLPKFAGRGRWKTHVTGVIVHGHSTKFFLDLMQFPHDSNLDLNCILNILYNTYSQERKLPPIIKIHLDNCSRENKNKFIIGFFFRLVEKRLINEAVVSFLMKGHTNEDIDQRFSKVSHSLKRRCARTLPELVNVIEGSLITSKLEVTVLRKIFDIRSWMEAFQDSLNNQTFPHVYRIRRLGETTVCHYKIWSTLEEWLPRSEEDEMAIFFKDADGNYILPEGVPNYVEEDWQRKHDVAEIRKAIETQKLQLNYEQYSWWNNFLRDPAEYYKSEPQESVGFLDEFEKQEPLESTETVAGSIRRATPLTLMLEKQHKCPPVYTGKRRKISEKGTRQTKQQNKTLKLCTGCMVAFKAKSNKNKVLIGQITTVTDDLISARMYEGKLSGVILPTVLPNGKSRVVKFCKERLVYVFKLKKSNRIPALALRKIKDDTTA